MAMSLADLQKAFAQKASGGGGGNQNWKLFFPFWKAAEDTTSIIRFLPDLNEDNEIGFLVENHVHELMINGEKKTVACLGMYGEACPICELSRKYYDEKDDKLGKRYYRKRSYIGQCLVIETPIEHNKDVLVKLIEFGPKIFQQIQAAFKSGDLEEVPYSFVGGYNFRIKKTKAGQYADYGTSTFAPKQSDVDPALIEKMEMYDLAEYRAERVERATLEAMLLADQTGQSYDTPASESADGDAASSSAAPAQAAQQAAPAPAAPPATSTQANDIIAQLRAKAAAKKAAAGQ